MAIEVIREGTPPENVSITFGCRACDSELKATRGDGELVSDQRDGDYIKYVCPVCKAVWTIGNENGRKPV